MQWYLRLFWFKHHSWNEPRCFLGTISCCMRFLAGSQLLCASVQWWRPDATQNGPCSRSDCVSVLISSKRQNIAASWAVWLTYQEACRGDRFQRFFSHRFGCNWTDCGALVEHVHLWIFGFYTASEAKVCRFGAPRACLEPKGCLHCLSNAVW